MALLRHHVDEKNMEAKSALEVQSKPAPEPRLARKDIPGGQDIAWGPNFG